MQDQAPLPNSISLLIFKLLARLPKKSWRHLTAETMHPAARYFTDYVTDDQKEKQIKEKSNIARSIPHSLSVQVFINIIS